MEWKQNGNIPSGSQVRETRRATPRMCGSPFEGSIERDRLVLSPDWLPVGMFISIRKHTLSCPRPKLLVRVSPLFRLNSYTFMRSTQGYQ
jgi:hypothetical protein